MKRIIAIVLISVIVISALFSRGQIEEKQRIGIISPMDSEMEGAAVALVCCTYKVPFVVIRTMSDKADGHVRESANNFGKDSSRTSEGTLIQEHIRRIQSVE